MKLNTTDKDFLRLIVRSPDLGNGWRQVSNMLWPLVEKFSHPELIEVFQSQVRLSEKGKVVAEYMA